MFMSDSKTSQGGHEEYSKESSGMKLERREIPTGGVIALLMRQRERHFMPDHRFNLLLVFALTILIAGCLPSTKDIVPPVPADIEATLPQKIVADAQIVSAGGTVLRDMGALVQAVKNRITIGKKHHTESVDQTVDPGIISEQPKAVEETGAMQLQEFYTMLKAVALITVVSVVVVWLGVQVVHFLHRRKGRV